ncbi:MAG TPA: protein kinase [Thermoanaerobaculia bacterium]|nr:protein kinase [Thermoanaerobaculia bacterium]
MTLAAGTRLGNYEVIGLLGVGGMGEVYRAHDTKLGREVALKVLPEAVGRDPGRVLRFEREARLLASVNHPGIAAIYGAEESGETRYLVLELVAGETLTERLRGTLGPTEALRIARQIAEALEAAHDRGIIHRDLKPSNVMVTPQGRVKILDLGLAKMMGNLKSDDARSQEMTAPPMEDTRPGVILGTVEFMSPEQARGKAIDKRTDIWAFGCILFECFSGRRCFAGESVSDAIASILLREPDWAALPADTPPAIRELLQRCLQKDPNHRLRDIGDARLAIEEVLAGIEPRRSSASGMRPASPAGNRGRLLAAAAVAAAAVIAIAAALAYRSAHSARSPEPAGKRLVAILPFRDLSNVRDGNLIGEGLVETVSARLGGTTGVQVVSPAAVVAASTNDSDSARVAKSLGASVYLRGSVQRSNDRVRITYSLWDARRGVELAGGTLDGTAADLFELQDRLVARVSAAQATPMTGRIPEPGLDSGDEQERYLKAVGLLQHYNTKASVDEAVAILEPLSRDAPKSPYVLASLARGYLDLYDLVHDPSMVTKAEDFAARARGVSPALVEVDVTLGELRLRSGNPAGALESFRQALATSPTNFDARLGLARALGAAGNVVEAENAFRQAIELQPTYWGGYSKFAGFYSAHGRYREAAAMFRRVTELNPNDALAFSNLGAVEELQGDLVSARASFQKSLSLSPTDTAWANLGTAEFFLGDFPRAAAAFDQAVRVNPRNYQLWSNLGDARRWSPGLRPSAAEAYARAVELARKELAVNPRQAIVHSTLALCFAKTGKLPEAVGEAAESIRLEPDNPEILYNAGIVSNLAGRSQEAVDRLRRAIAAGYPLGFVEHEPEIANLRSAGKLKP